MKHISKRRKYETDLGIQRTDFEKLEIPREEWDFDALSHGRIVHVHPGLLVKAKIEFISKPYGNQHQKIDRGQIRLREYLFTLMEPRASKEGFQ